MDITAMQHRKSMVKEIRYSFFRGIILFILSSFMNLFAYDTTSYKIKDLHTKQPHETLQLALQDFIDSIKNISNNTKQPIKVIQKLADAPKDKAIKVINHQGYTYCYRPTFIANESYITLDYCKYQTKARYDVLKRISMHVGGETWLCLSAPYSVLNKKEQWDYIRLRPCAINDPAQIWNYKNGAFYSKVGNYRIKDYKYYLYISRNPNDYYNHSLLGSMQDWVETKARPHSLNIKTTIGWYYNDTKNFIGKEKRGTTDEPIYFFYNPENKHLFSFSDIEGLFECVISYSSPGGSWNWTYTDFCKDTDTDKNLEWDIIYQADLGTVFLDHNRHFLRTTRYGPNWGNLYTMNGQYLEQDIANSPTSYFVLDPFLIKYYKFIGGNFSKNLEYCPAPGTKMVGARNFPNDYNFDENWLRLLYTIGTATDYEHSEEISVGACGICFLHTMEIIYQLTERYPSLPVTPHLFAYQPNMDPFISFEQLFPHLHRNYQFFSYVQGFPLFEHEDIYDRTLRVVRGTLAMTLGQYDFVYHGLMRNASSINSEINRILHSPHGSVWMVVTFRRDEHGVLGGHMQPVINTSRGLYVIPVNLPNVPYEVFLDAMTPATTIESARDLLADMRTIEVLAAIQVTPQNPFESNLSALLSFYDCSGDGAGARGSLTPINSALLNQCESGFCE